MLKPIVGAACLCAATVADAELIRLSGQQIRDLVAGATIEIEVPLGNKLPISYAIDGQLAGQARDLASYLGADSDTGRWWVTSDNQLCHKWNRWSNSEPQCLRLGKDGRTIHWWSQDGNSGTAVIAVPAPIQTALPPRPQPEDKMRVAADEAPTAPAGIVETQLPATQAPPEPDTKRAAQPAFKVANVARHDVLNVRSGPSAEFGVVGELQPGSRGVMITGGCRSVWCPVQHESTSGWVNRIYLANEEPLSVTPRRSPPGDLLAPDPTRSGLALRRRPGNEIEAAGSPAEVAFIFFLSQGWTEHQAAGIVGNLQVECGRFLDCSIGSGGIAQWRADRVTRFRQVFGYPLGKATFEDQLSYIQWELTHPTSPWKDSGRILKGAKDAASAASLFDVHYEKSSGDTREARIANARAILKKYGGRPTI